MAANSCLLNEEVTDAYFIRIDQFATEAIVRPPFDDEPVIGYAWCVRSCVPTTFSSRSASCDVVPGAAVYRMIH